MNCILDWQFILLKPINLVKCVFFSFDYSKLHIFLMDGHKCLKFYILMHKYIADIVFNFLKYIKKYPLFLPTFVVKILIFTQFIFFLT